MQHVALNIHKGMFTREYAEINKRQVYVPNLVIIFGKWCGRGAPMPRATVRFDDDAVQLKSVYNEAFT